MISFWGQLIHQVQAAKALPGPRYLRTLRWIHETVRPATYVEIGVRWGTSLRTALPGTRCIGIDPNPALRRRPAPNTRIFEMTSDAFFEQNDLADLLGAPHFSLAFIDGLHLFDQALADFTHLERFARSDSIIMIHDCLPLDRVTSERTRTTDFYSGDIWKLAQCLKEQRPDLKMATVRARPTGLCLVTGLNPRSEVLVRTRNEQLARYIPLTFDDYRNSPGQMPVTIENTLPAIRSWLGA
jgi:predicted O-methyltransferase YrrM